MKHLDMKQLEDAIRAVSVFSVLCLLIILANLQGINSLNTRVELQAMSQNQEIQEEVEAVATTTPKVVEDTAIATGTASWYDYVLDSGWSSVGHLVCATRDFERYSMVRVTNLENGKSVECKVTDYGPDASIFPERIVDLSSASFNVISDTRLGIIKEVSVEQL